MISLVERPLAISYEPNLRLRKQVLSQGEAMDSTTIYGKRQTEPDTSCVRHVGCREKSHVEKLLG